jgi:hypothetical protein
MRVIQFERFGALRRLEERFVREARHGVRCGQVRRCTGALDQLVEGVGTQIARAGGRGSITDEHPQAHAFPVGLLDLLGLSESNTDLRRARGDIKSVRRRRAVTLRALKDLGKEFLGCDGITHGLLQLLYAEVPPTVRPSMRMVGMPTPTGTD